MWSGDFEVQPATLVKGNYWRVIVEGTAGGSGRYLTNYVLTETSGKESEALARRMASRLAAARLGNSEFEIQPPELIQGYFWRLVVWWLPARPGGSIIMDVSAADGTVMDPFLTQWLH